MKFYIVAVDQRQFFAKRLQWEQYAVWMPFFFLLFIA